jgi:hypothetical protein
VTKTRKKTTLVVVTVLCILIIATEFKACFWTRDYARQHALRRVTDYCLSTGRDPKLLTAGKEQTVGNATWSFDWTYQGLPRHFIGTWISRSGHVELFTGDPDDPESTAYEPH